MSFARLRVDEEEYRIIQAYRDGGDHQSEVPSSRLGGEPTPNIGIIGDSHAPVTHRDYLSFCKSTFEEYDCKIIVHIGDLVDWHSVSYHEKEPEAPTVTDEHHQALGQLQAWYEAFPDVKMCIGNHDARIMRKAKSAGLPSAFVKSYEEIMQMPAGWDVKPEHMIGGVLFTHGEPYGGMYGAKRAAVMNGVSVVMGHTHTNGGVFYVEQRERQIFGLQVTCGIDVNTVPMRYALRYAGKVSIGCGTITDNGRVGHYVPMK